MSTVSRPRKQKNLKFEYVIIINLCYSPRAADQADRGGPIRGPAAPGCGRGGRSHTHVYGHEGGTESQRQNHHQHNAGYVQGGS